MYGYSVLSTEMPTIKIVVEVFVGNTYDDFLMDFFPDDHVLLGKSSIIVILDDFPREMYGMSCFRVV